MIIYEINHLDGQQFPSSFFLISHFPFYLKDGLEAISALIS